MTRGLYRFDDAGHPHFVTFSCYRRQPFFNNTRTYDLFPFCLERMRRRFQLLVYGYVVMPEHVHLLLERTRQVARISRALYRLHISCLLSADSYNRLGGHKMASVSPELLRRLNNVDVTFDELNSIFEQFAELDAEARDLPDMSLHLIAENNKGNFEKSQAISFRIRALGEVIEQREAPGWTLPGTEKGCTLMRHELIRAAAVFPLSEVNGDVAFELDAFLSKALELADVEGHA